MTRPTTINHITEEFNPAILTEKDLRVRSIKEHIEWLASIDSRLGKNTMQQIKYYNNKLNKLKQLM